MSRAVILAGYVVIAVTAVALELAARRDRRWATAGDAIVVVTRRWPVRLLLLAGWLWLGWHVFVRVDWQ
jgi:Family of unknown function (DUF6186)